MVADDIRRTAAGKFADIGCRFIVDAAKLHRRNRLAGDLDGADAILRIHSGMCGFAKNLHRHLRLGWSRYRNGAYLTIGIQGKAELGIQMGRVHVPGTQQPRLFSSGNDKLNLSMSQLLLLNDPDRFK
ncbi:hypothetical protein D3C75_1008530 [compost metagenome]